ncbi:MAG: D-glycerate dehydrogenase [candidate division NC10 bacterium]|nr:D-glycerate dehydrogenase [candidate division NC10 bacterium]
MKPKVLITRTIPKEALEIVQRSCEVELLKRDRSTPKRELIRRLQGKEGVISFASDIFDEEVFSQVPHLKIVSTVAVGYDNIDVQAATRHKVMVTNTPGVLTDTTADLTWALLLATARRIVEGDHFVRAGKWKHWMFMLLLGHDIHHKTLGIVGFGRIGQAVARRAKGFDMRILYTDLFQADKAAEEAVNATYVDKETLLKESDFVCLHTPLTPETIHFIGEKELKMMKKTAILVNAARGPVVDEKALVKALRQGWIAGAGLDVFEKEPKIERRLLSLKNVVMAPHIGSATMETRIKMVSMAAENCVAGLMGKRPPNLLNPEVWQG